MQLEPRMTKAELSAAYNETDWQQGFIRLVSLSELLRGSIIDKDYKIPDEMNNALYLTATGGKVAEALKTKHEVPYKEAKLMCLLAGAYREPLVDVERTNYAVLVDEISKQILAGTLRHPYIFARDLYDRAASLFPERRRYLNVKDTYRLLEGMPAGVWQVQGLVTGPFGIIQSETTRSLSPHTDLPLQHCPDISCDRLHYVQLSTNQEADINSHQFKFNRLMEQGDREPSDWNGFIDDLLKETRAKSDREDLDPGSITFLLGDGLAESELRHLVAALLDNTQGRLRAVASRLGLRGQASDIVAGLKRAQLMQLSLCCADADIAKTLDDLVADRLIEVPIGEIRRARVSASFGYGSYGLRAELSEHGVRYVSSSDIPALRLRRLIADLYDTDGGDQSALEWRLRSVDGSNVQYKLSEYLRVAPPREILANLVLATGERAMQACAHLGITWRSGWGDDAIIEALLWKLGLPLRTTTPVHDRFYSRLDRMTKLVRGAQLSAAVDEGPIREAASLFFEDLERLLNDALAYATWALTTDHYSSEMPYTFRPVLDTKAAMSQLSDAAVQHAPDPDDVILFGEQNTLYPLCRGFGILGRMLENYQQAEDLHRRDEDTFPDYVKEGLRIFPLQHTVPFLDLVGRAQERIIAELAETSRILVSQNVSSVRNGLTHFRTSSANLDEVISALTGVQQAVRNLEAMGMLRTPFSHVSTAFDDWGRSTVTLASEAGQMVAFTRPSPYDSLKMPNLSRDQYLMHGAIFAEPNEVLRFVAAQESPYELMWMEYPKRRAASDNAVANQSENGAAVVDARGRSSTRTG